MSCTVSLLRSLRAFLVLGRISNLPTIWSNCLAAWLLGGAGSWKTFLTLSAGGTLLYTGGMFLNDACDAGFDQKYRPERPIPSGTVGRGVVWIGSAILLVLGWVLLVPLGKRPMLFGSALLACIVVYDVIHKHTKLAPILMAGCRFLLYLASASAGLQGLSQESVLRALAMWGYVLGLSYIARGESGGSTNAVRWWPAVFLVAPMILTLIIRLPQDALSWAVLTGTGIWVFWCLWLAFAKLKIGPSVAGLLAGIVLVDWLASLGAGHRFALAFAGLFLLARLMQKAVPAT